MYRTAWHICLCVCRTAWHVCLSVYECVCVYVHVRMYASIGQHGMSACVGVRVSMHECSTAWHVCVCVHVCVCKSRTAWHACLSMCACMHRIAWYASLSVRMCVHAHTRALGQSMLNASCFSTYMDSGGPLTQYTSNPFRDLLSFLACLHQDSPMPSDLCSSPH